MTNSIYTAESILPEASSGETHTLNGLGDFNRAVTQLLNSTRHSLHILSNRLPNALFGNPALTNDITRISKHAGRFADIRVLIKHPQGLTRPPLQPASP